MFVGSCDWIFRESYSVEWGMITISIHFKWRGSVANENVSKVGNFIWSDGGMLRFLSFPNDQYMGFSNCRGSAMSMSDLMFGRMGNPDPSGSHS